MCDGWLTKVVVRRIPGLGGGWRAAGTSTDGPVDADDVAIFMHRSGTTAVPERDEVIEAARLALIQGGDVFGGGRGSDLRRALLEEYDEPIAALIGCHLLLRAMAGPTGTQTDRGAVFDRAVERLRSLLGSGRVEHPDVHALSLQCTTERLRAAGPVAAPPMFADSWRLLVNASYDRPDLLPPAMWEQVHASIRKGPFFVWAVDDATKGAHAQQLARWLHRAETVGSGPPTDGTDVPTAADDPGRRPAAAHPGRGAGRPVGGPDRAPVSTGGRRKVVFEFPLSETLTVSFQRYPCPAAGVVSALPRSWGALPVAEMGPRELAVPVPEGEAVWLGLRATAEARRWRLAVVAHLDPGGPTDAVTGLPARVPDDSRPS